MDYKYEYGRAKKKIETLQKQLLQAQETADAWQQIVEANNAIIYAVVESAGGEITVKQESINRALKDGCGLMSSYNEETMEHTIKTGAKPA